MRRAGFTLIEVLVALAIFALIAVGGVAMLGFTTDNQAAVRSRLDEIARIERAHALIASDLSQLADRPSRGLDGRLSASFSANGGAGDRILLRFVRRGWENPDGAPRASLQYVEYALVERRLERRARVMLDGAPLGPPLVLLENVDAIEIAYWQNEAWISRAGEYHGPPPQAVQLSISEATFGPMRLAVLMANP